MSKTERRFTSTAQQQQVRIKKKNSNNHIEKWAQQLSRQFTEKKYKTLSIIWREALSGESKLKQQKDHLRPIRLQKGESWMLLSVGRQVE